MRLQSKLALTMAAAASVAIFLMASGFWVVAVREQRRTVDEFLVDRLDEVRSFTEVGDGEPGRRPRPGPRDVFDQGVSLRFRFVRPDGQVVLDDGLPEVDGTSRPRFETLEIDGDRYRMVSAELGRADRPATVQIAQNIEDTELALDRLQRRILFGSALGVALAALFGAVVARRLSAPIRKVADAAREMALHQDLPSRIEVERADEIGELATSFNQMLTALETSRGQQSRLVADASHELRTPLTSLRLKIDLLDSTPDLPDGQRRELLSGAAIELERLTDLVTELVELASDPAGVQEAVVDADLLMLVSDVARRTERTSGRPIAVEGEATHASVRPRMVARAVSNLLDNAIKYSADETPIEVRVGGGRIEVRDHGEGIPEADLEHIFDRFFRSPAARTRPGNGIGLAIVERVAELHDGEVFAHNVVGQRGAIVGFTVGLVE